MLARHFEAEAASLATLLDNPELAGPGPEPKPVPDNYQRHFASLGLVRVRRGLASASLLLGAPAGFFTLRHGDAAIDAVRFASAFFGKGQFVPDAWERQGASWVLGQHLEPRTISPSKNAWRRASGARCGPNGRRARSAGCAQTATVTETPGGFRLRLEASGTDGVPVAVEIGLREGGRLSGCQRVAGSDGCWLLGEGEAVYEAGGQRIRSGRAPRCIAMFRFAGRSQAARRMRVPDGPDAVPPHDRVHRGGLGDLRQLVQNQPPHRAAVEPADIVRGPLDHGRHRGAIAILVQPQQPLAQLVFIRVGPSHGWREHHAPVLVAYAFLMAGKQE